MITPTPVPNVPVIPLGDGTSIQIPSGITGVSLVLIVLWIITQNLPNIIKNLTELLQTLVAGRRNQNSAYEGLVKQMSSDREYWETQREQMMKEIGELREKVDHLEDQIADRDKIIADMKRNNRRY